MKVGFKKLGCFVLALAMLFTSVCVFADETDRTVTVELTDVTQSDVTTLKGEAKVKVSLVGAEGAVEAAQVELKFGGDLKYKTIEWIVEDGFTIATEADGANREKRLTAGIANTNTNGMSFDNKTDMFIVTFEGTAGKSVDVEVVNERSFAKTADNQYFTSGTASISATATNDANEAKTAVVKILMDKITDFAAESDKIASVVTLKLTGEKSGVELQVNLKNSHRGSGTVANFIVSKEVLKDDTYTVELEAPGYVPYKKTGVSFEGELEITNAEFIPGDVNKDEKVDAADKTACEKLIADKEYSEAADFNRDGYVDSLDLAVFGENGGSGDSAGDSAGDSNENAPAKMSKPTVTGGEEKITVKWSKPTGTITGYVIKYGENEISINEEIEINDSTKTEYVIDNLDEDTEYFVKIAAKNAFGTGAFSDVASATTDEGESGGSSGGSGGGGGGGGGGGASSGGSAGGSTGTTGGTTVTPVEPGKFGDIAIYAWAEEAIYRLKDKGIISGVSETEFAPQNNIKRGDFILILVRMLGLDNEYSDNFADVPETSYYYDAIGKAKAAGIATGDGVNFMPENTITRQDLITLSYRAFLNLGYIEEVTDLAVLDEFGDKDSIAEYAKSPMASMVSAGIIKGADGNVNPNGNATRAEVAVMCDRLTGLMK